MSKRPGFARLDDAVEWAADMLGEPAWRAVIPRVCPGCSRYFVSPYTAHPCVSRSTT